MQNWKKILLGLSTAFLAGAGEFIMTSGTSGWTPLIAGLTSILLAPFLTVPLIKLVEWWQRKWNTDSLPPPQRPWWEAPGSLQTQFKLYEAACLLDNQEPAWPVPTLRARDEYCALVSEITSDNLRHNLAFEFGSAEFHGKEHELLISHKDLRKHLRSMKRPLPPFLRKIQPSKVSRRRGSGSPDARNAV